LEITRTAVHEWAADGIRCFAIMPPAETDVSRPGIERDPEGYAKRMADRPSHAWAIHSRTSAGRWSSC
jgi:hypothetical protein